MMAPLRADLGAQLDVSQAGEAAHDDSVSRRQVSRPREISTKSGELRKLGFERAGLGLAVAGVADEAVENYDLRVSQRNGGRRVRRRSGEHR
jgi:hypothetical protein